jgi:hypothetical protein
VRTRPPLLLLCSVGEVLMFKSDYKYWFQTKGSSVLS